jgi:hypothetical protein
MGEVPVTLVTKLAVLLPVPPFAIGSTPVNEIDGVRPPLDAMLPLPLTDVTGDVTKAAFGTVPEVILAPDIMGADENVLMPAID